MGQYSGFLLQKPFTVRDLAGNGLVTSVIFTVKDHIYQGKPFNAKAVYSFRKATYDIHLNLGKNEKGNFLNASGLPIRSGDEFFITFSNLHPDNYRLSFDRPTIKQVERYREHLLQQYFDKTPNLDVSRFHCNFNETFITKGVAGLVALYRFPEENNTSGPLKNRKTLMGEQECR